jgi:hypothetical protein
MEVMGFWKFVGFSCLGSCLDCRFGGILEQVTEVGEAIGCCMALLLLLLLGHKSFAEATH